MSSLLENIKRTTHAQFEGYRKWDLDAILAPRAENCVYKYLPETMNRPAMNNTEFREYFATIIPLLQGFDFTLSHELYDENSRQSACHGFSTATTAVGPYRMEMVIIMKFDESGEKIVQIDEMMDSAYMADLLARLGAHMQSQAEAK